MVDKVPGVRIPSPPVIVLHAIRSGNFRQTTSMNKTWEKKRTCHNNSAGTAGACPIVLQRCLEDASRQDGPERHGQHCADGAHRLLKSRCASRAATTTRSARFSRRKMLVRTRVRIDNELGGLLRGFGVLFGKRVGSFRQCAGEIIAGESDAAPEMRLVAQKPMKARASILDQIKVLDSLVCRRQVSAGGATVHDRAGRGRDYRVVGRFSLRRCIVLLAFNERGRLSRPDAPALRVGRDQSQRSHLQAGHATDQKAPRRFEIGSRTYRGKLTPRGKFGIAHAELCSV